MQKVIVILFLTFGLVSFHSISSKFEITKEISTEKFDIKIKNDTDNEVKVINAGSGGSYSLAKNTTTTIKMEEGDKLYYYIKGKKGDLILVATKEMNGKLQLLSNL